MNPIFIAFIVVGVLLIVGALSWFVYSVYNYYSKSEHASVKKPYTLEELARQEQTRSERARIKAAKQAREAENKRLAELIRSNTKSSRDKYVFIPSSEPTPAELRVNSNISSLRHH